MPCYAEHLKCYLLSLNLEVDKRDAALSRKSRTQVSLEQSRWIMNIYFICMALIVHLYICICFVFHELSMSGEGKFAYREQSSIRTDKTTSLPMGRGRGPVIQSP